MTSEESLTLNIIRWLSTIGILACHFLQGLGSIWAWVLNIGVQVFFFLSGFIYGTIRIHNTKKFYLRRLRKIYIPYVVWVLISVILLIIFSPESVSVIGVGRQLTLTGLLPGLKHLWFLQVIFGCYLLLPVVDRLFSKNSTLSLIFLSSVFALALIFSYHPYFLWILVYYIGYISGRFERTQKRIFIISIITSIVLFLSFDCDLYTFKKSCIINDLLHASIGIMIFMMIWFGTKRLLATVEHNNRMLKIFNFGGGYEVYLTHHIFILSPISLLFITSATWFNIIIICILTIACSIMIKEISSRINKVI